MVAMKDVLPKAGPMFVASIRLIPAGLLLITSPLPPPLSPRQDVLPKAGPMFVASVRLIPAGLLLVAFAASRGRPMPKSALAWFSILLFALVDATAFQVPLMLAAGGLRRTSPGLGSASNVPFSSLNPPFSPHFLNVIIDSQPLTVAVLAALLFGETISKKGALGLVLGVVGLLLLEVPLDALFSFASSLSASSTQSVLATVIFSLPSSLSFHSLLTPFTPLSLYPLSLSSRSSHSSHLSHSVHSSPLIPPVTHTSSMPFPSDQPSAQP
ncbi:unnamed protein product [Closterium sp. NIES-65]|nr:unnamed protein product [Closterium sp. NIES-65]